MSLFKKAFEIVLEQDADVEVKGGVTPNTDREAMAAQLDTTKPEDYDVDAAALAAADASKIEQKRKLQEWIVKIDEFTNFLNATDNTSVQTQLHKAGCESIFDKIARSETKKISRLASELSALSQSLKGYLISNAD